MYGRPAKAFNVGLLVAYFFSQESTPVSVVGNPAILCSTIFGTGGAGRVKALALMY